MKIKKLFLLVMIMGIFSFLFGCSKKPSPVEEESEVIARVELPEGVKLSGFYMNHSGMRMNPYYILKTTDSGTYMKITDKCPEDYWMYSEESAESLIQPAEYFGYVETVREDERASLVCLEDESVIHQLEECIAKYGALGWDGYDKSKAMPNVTDSGDNYNLYLELSDGTTVKMHGYNTSPSGFRELYQEAVQIFQSCSDDSGYEAIKKAVVKETHDFYMEENSVVEKPAVTLAEKIRGSYMYYPKREETKLDQSAVKEKEEEGFNEEYLIKFRYINQALVAEVNYQRDFNSVYSRHRVELNPVSEQALESTTETSVQLAGREFSGFSMFGEYWDDAVSLELQVVDEGLA